MAVVPNGLHVEQEGNQEADQYGEGLYGEAQVTLVAVDERRLRTLPAAVGHEDGDEGAEHDGRGGQEGRRHYVVSQCLNC